MALCFAYAAGGQLAKAAVACERGLETGFADNMVPLRLLQRLYCQQGYELQSTEAVLDPAENDVPQPQVCLLLCPISACFVN